MLRVFLSLLLIVSSSWSFAMSGMQVEPRNSLLDNPAPAFSLETTSGSTRSLAEASGSKKVILLFWATWCPYCHVGLEKIHRNADAIEKAGVQVLLVNVGESREEARAFLKKRGLPLESFLDEDNTVTGEYNVRGLPTVIFIDEKGIVQEIDFEFPTDFASRFRSK